MFRDKVSRLYKMCKTLHCLRGICSFSDDIYMNTMKKFQTTHMFVITSSELRRIFFIPLLVRKQTINHHHNYMHYNKALWFYLKCFVSGKPEMQA